MADKKKTRPISKIGRVKEIGRWILDKLSETAKNTITSKVELINQTIDFSKGLVRKTYKITTVIYKSGDRNKITTILVTVSLALNLKFGWFRSNTVRIEQQKTSFSRMVPSHIAQYEKLDPSQLVVKNYRKPDKIRFTDIVKIDPSLYLFSPELAHQIDREKILKRAMKIVNVNRGGNIQDRLLHAAALLGLIIFLSQLPETGLGFNIHYIHPNGAIIKPNGGIYGNQPKSYPYNFNKVGGRLTLRMSNSGQSSSSVQQVANFFTVRRNQAVVNWDLAYGEVNRRAQVIGNENFKCSMQRFKALSRENNRVTQGSVREAISALQGEMLGYYTNTVRVDYGKGVSGVDFKVEGKGEFSHITHLEIKNSVGSKIEQASRGKTDIGKQARGIGAKISKQQVNWSNPNYYNDRTKFPHIDLTAPFPESPDNVLGLVDEFDVPSSEKSIMENETRQSLTTSESSIIFINNIKNV